MWSSIKVGFENGGEVVLKNEQKIMP